MRVIKEGNAGKNRAKCCHCGSLIEYIDGELSEVNTYDYTFKLKSWSKYLFCPVCKHKVVVDAVAYE